MGCLMKSSIKGNKGLPYLLIGPACILILVFKICPILYTLVEGFTYKGSFGLGTYALLFQDPSFYKSLWVTIKMNLIITPLQIVLAVGMALLVNTTVKGIGVFRTILYLPVTISITVATMLWGMMFNANNGIINSILSIFGMAKQGFLTDVNQAIWCIIVIATWIGVGYWMIFLLAGLKNIDEAIYESARIDGAGWFTRLFRITLPMIKNVLLFVLVADTTTNLLLFVPMQLLTEGGPQGSTNVLMYEGYKSAFLYVDRPRSAAIVTVLLLLISLVCIIQYKLFEEKDEKRIKKENKEPRLAAKERGRIR